MNCLWCRGAVGKIPNYRSPDFCCSRCEHRFYSTGHKLDEDRLREQREADERAARSKQLEDIYSEWEWLGKGRRELVEKEAQLAQMKAEADTRDVLAFTYFLLGTVALAAAAFLHFGGNT